MEFVPAPEYPVFPTAEQPLKPYQAVLQATEPTRAAIAARRPDIVVHDILTLAPALAAELEGIRTATLIPHLYPVTAPGFPPYSIGARLPRTAPAERFWGSVRAAAREGPASGPRRAQRDPPASGACRRSSGSTAASAPTSAWSRRSPSSSIRATGPTRVHVVGPMLWEPPAPAVAPPPGDAPLVVLAPSTSHDPSSGCCGRAWRGCAGTEVRVLAATDRRRRCRADPGRHALPAWSTGSPTPTRCPTRRLVVCHAGHGTLVQALGTACPCSRFRTAATWQRTPRASTGRAPVSGCRGGCCRAPTLRLAVGRALDSHGGAGDPRAASWPTWAAANDGPTRAAELLEDLLR